MPELRFLSQSRGYRNRISKVLKSNFDPRAQGARGFCLNDACLITKNQRSIRNVQCKAACEKDDSCVLIDLAGELVWLKWLL